MNEPQDYRDERDWGGDPGPDAGDLAQLEKEAAAWWDENARWWRSHDARVLREMRRADPS